MEKRYQVFVSSTYDDLRDERSEVMHALLELDCIPAGMELFPAANDDQWTVIKSVIDECDYYIVIVAGRYGSIGPNGLSYTEMEYRYAMEIGKPVIAFLHKDPTSIPAKFTEQNPDGKTKLRDFGALCKQKMAKFWSSPDDLGAAVSRSLVKLVKTHPAVGWVRADQIPDETSAREVLRLQAQVESLRAELAHRATPTPKNDNLRQGDDSFRISFKVTAFDFEHEDVYHEWSDEITLTWNEIFGAVAPRVALGPIPGSVVFEALGHFVFREGETKISKVLADLKIEQPLALWEVAPNNLIISVHDRDTITVQLLALDLVEITHDAKGANLWNLTPHGKSEMIKLRAEYR